MLRALLIGINTYHPAGGVRALRGCRSDVQAMHDFLLAYCADQISDGNHVRILLDGQATRANVIAAFREHLAPAGADDTVLIYYAGHGSQSVTAPEFQGGTTDQLEEGWVLHDSRNPGNYDLADKEIALLLEEVGRNNPHIVVISDSCHSNSLTRSGAEEESAEDGPDALNARFTQGQKIRRTLASYLDGAYVQRQAANRALDIPFTRSILLSACDKTEQALESGTQGGLFTKALLEALRQSGGQIRYGDLYTRTAATIRALTGRQNPQTDLLGGFNPNAGFLGRPLPAGPQRRYAVKFDLRSRNWRIELGAAHGLVSDTNTAIDVVLYELPVAGTAVRTATLASIGATESAFEGEPLDLNPAKTYWGEPNRLPLAPFILYGAPGPALSNLRAALDAQPESAVLLTDNPANCDFEVRNEMGNFVVYDLRSNALVHGVRGDGEKSVQYMTNVLNHLAHWHRLAGLQNRHTELNHRGVRLHFYRQEGADWLEMEGDDVELHFEGARINFRMSADNLSGEPLYMLLVYLDPQFGASVLFRDTQPVPHGKEGLFLVENHFHLPRGVDEESDVLKLIVSNERIEPGLFSKPPLMRGVVDPMRDGNLRGIGGLSRPDWFAKTMRVRVIRK